MKYLPLYKKWAKIGTLPFDGLCKSVHPDFPKSENSLLKLFEPALDECADYGVNFYGYWGGGHIDDPRQSEHDRLRSFNDFRQNVLLFMAAMNNEL